VDVDPLGEGAAVGVAQLGGDDAGRFLVGRHGRGQRVPQHVGVGRDAAERLPNNDRGMSPPVVLATRIARGLVVPVGRPARASRVGRRPIAQRPNGAHSGRLWGRLEACWSPVGEHSSARTPSKPTRPRHGSTSKRRPISTRQRHTAAWPPPISKGPRCRGERRTPGRRWGISARQNCGRRNRLVPTASRRASRACAEDHLRAVTGGTYGSRCRRLG
jgi:hypothetical protein